MTEYSAKDLIDARVIIRDAYLKCVIANECDLGKDKLAHAEDYINEHLNTLLMDPDEEPSNG